MNKERVIVFDGEDKFIAPRDRTYDAKKGTSKSNSQLSKEAERFKAFMLKQNTPVTIPSPTEEDFCKKIAVFIKTNGDGRATPDMVMDALKLFQDNCIEKPKEVSETGEQITRDTIVDTPTTADAPPAIVFPDWNTISCEVIDSEIANLEQILMVSRFTPDVRSQYEAAIAAGKAAKETKCPKNPPALPDVPPTGGGGGGTTVLPTVLPPTGVSLSTPKLGLPPKSGQPVGGGEEKKDEPKKGSNWLIWVLLGGAALYFLTRKKD